MEWAELVEKYQQNQNEIISITNQLKALKKD